MFLGFKTLPINQYGYPVEYATGYEASCFILFFHIIWVGEVKEVLI